jgi:2-succinyl-5-enolpyruvyl-6-hydroxy-3-cyclohexene-1-carboxylate synthase
LRRWLSAGLAATGALNRMLDDELRDGVLTGPALAREVSGCLGPGEALVVSSSNAVRDLDLAGGPFPDPQLLGPAPVVLANRGLAGIDGTLSTACGVALARAATGLPLPVRVLLGDLAFVHDINGLLSGPAERRVRLQVIVLDDAGGGIFCLLEPGDLAVQDVSGAGTAVFERVFATESGADLRALSTAVGARYVPVDHPVELRAALTEPAAGVSVLHVRVGRQGRRAQAEALAGAVRAAVDAVVTT